MFDPADAPSPKGWSKRQANAQVRIAKRDAMNVLAAMRQRHFAAVAAGFSSAEEHEAHLAALNAPVTPAAPEPVDDTPAAEEPASAAPEAADESSAATDDDTAVDGERAATAPKPRGRRKAAA